MLLRYFKRAYTQGSAKTVEFPNRNKIRETTHSYIRRKKCETLEYDQSIMYKTRSLHLTAISGRTISSNSNIEQLMDLPTLKHIIITAYIYDTYPAEWNVPVADLDGKKQTNHRIAIFYSSNRVLRRKNNGQT